MLDVDMLCVAIGTDEDAEKAYLIGKFRRFFRPRWVAEETAVIAADFCGTAPSLWMI